MNEVDFSGLSSSATLQELAFWVVGAVALVVVVYAALYSHKKRLKLKPLPKPKRRGWLEEIWDREVLGPRADWDQ